MPADYFHYLPENPLCASWGCTATALGRTRIQPGSAYPPQRHPDAHHFTWESGRILESFQVVYISSGQGTFESARTPGPQPVKGGSLLVLFPGVWHRYAPDPAVGWVEQWLEYRSPAFDAAVANDSLRPEQPIRTASADLVRLFDQSHSWAEGGAALPPANPDLSPRVTVSRAAAGRPGGQQRRSGCGIGAAGHAAHFGKLPPATQHAAARP